MSIYDRQERVNAIFTAALSAPRPENYTTHAAYTEAFDAYQAEIMQPLRDKLTGI